MAINLTKLEAKLRFFQYGLALGEYYREHGDWGKLNGGRVEEGRCFSFSTVPSNPFLSLRAHQNIEFCLEFRSRRVVQLFFTS